MAVSFVSRRNSLGASKKRGTSASADSANDTVPVDKTVRVPQDFKNGTEFKRINVRVDYKFVLALAKALN
jgi:hypothetical protein